jgi:hypothetical protein
MIDVSSILSARAIGQTNQPCRQPQRGQRLLTIFCNLAINHVHPTAELGRCEKFMAAGQETMAAAASPKCTIIFLKAVSCPLEAESDLVEPFEGAKFIDFMAEIPR